METMGDRIRQLRQARGLTQREIAEACGVTPSAVSQWESNLIDNIKLQPFLSLLEVLGTDPQYLLWGAARAPEKTPKSHRG